MNRYKDEAKARWGNTQAFSEYIEKCKDKSRNQSEIIEGLENIFADFAECLKDSNTPKSDKAQVLVKNLQEYISANFYTCTSEILAGLGKMYVADERFKTNIDKHAEGTAEFVSRAIEIYCEK
ncbi:MAG: TipAS antibiotic-recognition domain-containing protein [Oscillospiraceae bacterium]|nr:TipAS antibiotic-recognition domain-containing protein [Oscillospiraceae bacterium]